MTAKKIRPYVKALLAAALLGTFGYLFFFWQNDFYPALTGSQSALTLQRNLAAQTIDVKKFKILADKINQTASTTTSTASTSNPFR
jgi:hypothetical protein